MVNRTGQMGVPVTIIDGETIIGFNQARLDQVLAQRQAARPSFGTAVADASRHARGVTSGAYVGRVRPGSAAERMGIAPGDVIVQVNMQQIVNAADLEAAVSRLGQGSRVSVRYLRDGRTLSSEGTL